MSTPIVIAHIAHGNKIVQAITYFQNGQFHAVFQIYTVFPTGRTSLQHSMPWSSEKGALDNFRDYCANNDIKVN